MGSAFRRSTVRIVRSAAPPFPTFRPRLPSGVPSGSGRRTSIGACCRLSMHDLSIIVTLAGGLAVALVFGWVTQRLGLSTLVG